MLGCRIRVFAVGTESGWSKGLIVVASVGSVDAETVEVVENMKLVVVLLGVVPIEVGNILLIAAYPLGTAMAEVGNSLFVVHGSLVAGKVAV